MLKANGKMESNNYIINESISLSVIRNEKGLFLAIWLNDILINSSEADKIADIFKAEIKH